MKYFFFILGFPNSKLWKTIRDDLNFGVLFFKFILVHEIFSENLL